MTGFDWLAAVGLLLVIEGALPFAAPAAWREGFRRILELRDGQLRFIGAAPGGPTRISRLRCRKKRWMQGASRTQGLPLAKWRNAADALSCDNPKGRGAIRVHSFVASCLQ
jgi:uncharacterized protein YjeT (DUF2065 family)